MEMEHVLLLKRVHAPRAMLETSASTHCAMGRTAPMPPFAQDMVCAHRQTYVLVLQDIQELNVRVLFVLG